MKKIGAITTAVFTCGMLAGATTPNGRLGLKCAGQVWFSASNVRSDSEDHYVVDRTKRKLIQRDEFSGKAITTYALTVNSRFYSGERQEDGKTNGGFYVHHFETVQISREDGRITSSSLSTTTLPNGPSTNEMKFEGQCVSENPDQRKAPKF